MADFGSEAAAAILQSQVQQSCDKDCKERKHRSRQNDAVYE
jgi:hypothetical protein